MNMAMANTEKNGMRGSLKRVDAVDATTAVEVFKAAILFIVPKDRSNRKMFASLMSYMYVLRNDGCTWEQITKLLADCNINLQVSTVRTYYSEMLADRQDECQRRLNEQIIMLREVRKVTEGADATFESVAGMATAIYDRHKRQALPTVDKLFGAGSDEHQDEERRQAVSTAQRSTAQPEGKEIAGRSPAAEKPDTAPPGGDFGFGLMSAANSKPVVISKPWVDDEPAIPVLTGEPASPVVPKTAKAAPAAPQPVEKIAENHAAASPLSKKTTAPTPASPEIKTTLRCLPLQEGVPPLSRRAEVPSTVYEIGLLEHPAIPGLMLSLEERLFGGYLSLVDTDGGETRQESIKEKPWRIQWKKPIVRSESRTEKDHVSMNMALFKKRAE